MNEKNRQRAESFKEINQYNIPDALYGVTIQILTKWCHFSSWKTHCTLRGKPIIVEDLDAFQAPWPIGVKVQN